MVTTLSNDDTAQRIYALRNQRGWTQSELAQMTGLERKSIIRYENGQNVPGGKALASLANVFGVTTDYLLGLSTSPYAVPTSSNDLTSLELEAIQAFRRAHTEDQRQRLLNALIALVPTDLP